MIAGLYCRVSTVDQDNSLQIAALTTYAEKMGWTSEVFQDQMSGGKNDRPGLNALMDAARRRLVDVVIVTKLDRFGRSTVDILNNLRELEQRGVRFLAIDQGLDTGANNAVSRFLISILGSVAELEREMIVERVRAGQVRARARGVKFGAPHKVFDRAGAVEMRKAGGTLRDIARAHGVGLGTIFRLLADVPQSGVKTGPKTDQKHEVLGMLAGRSEA
jgi:putative DNA-invertase from lambdoid prophage Rac